MTSCPLFLNRKRYGIQNITFVTGFPIVVNYADLKSVIMHVFFKENNSRITDRIVKELIEMFENFNISASVQSSVLEIVTMINYEIFRCGLIIQLAFLRMLK